MESTDVDLLNHKRHMMRLLSTDPEFLSYVEPMENSEQIRTLFIMLRLYTSPQANESVQ